MRSLSLDIVENAGTGHLGMPLGASPMAYELFKNHINIDPKSTDWFNRDRFILSAGHGTPLLYSLMTLFGYDMTIDDLKAFRKLDSITPGHPEVTITPGVDATTGPLGQGFAMAVGMAIAEAHLREKYNKDNLNIVDHYTYVICGDGDLMEGIASESASIAGALSLERLIILHDSNKVCSDGLVSDSTIDDYEVKFRAMGWNYLIVEDGEVTEEVGKAIEEAKKSDKPTLIEVKNTIGFGSTLAESNAIHSDPVGEEEAIHIKQSIEWEFEEEFYIPDEVKNVTEEYIKSSEEKRLAWEKVKQQYKEKYPQEYKELFEIEQLVSEIDYSEFERYTEALATRNASGDSLNYIYDRVPFLLGGSADLATSNKVIFKNSSYMNSTDKTGNNIAFGIREFAMGAITNGITLHGGATGFCATFLVFLDYMKSALRHAAIMKINPIYIYTHDSIIVGPDGPTHQPIEQLPSLRAIPNVDVIRPCDGNETFYAWQYAVKNDKPTVLVLCRQNIPIQEFTSAENLKKGAYVIYDCDDYDATVIATGSEVDLTIGVVDGLEDDGLKLRIVNMPSWELFEKQDKSYQDFVIDKSKPVISVEASSGFGWERYTGCTGNIICVNDFGESGNGNDLYDLRGFSVKAVSDKIREIIKRNR